MKIYFTVHTVWPIIPYELYKSVDIDIKFTVILNSHILAVILYNVYLQFGKVGL